MRFELQVEIVDPIQSGDPGDRGAVDQEIDWNQEAIDQQRVSGR